MGFKWFKARISMNRTPVQSSAVAGSYRIKAFDEPNNEFRSNYNQRDNGHIKPEPKLSIRPISMPVLNNPMDEVSNGDGDLRFVPLSNNETTRSSSTLEGLEFDERKMYSGLGIKQPVSLVEQKSKSNSNLSENIAPTTPRPMQKTQKGDYKKKKVKAPAPKMNLSRSSASTSENGSAEFLTLQNRRKISQSSDIDV